MTTMTVDIIATHYFDLTSTPGTEGIYMNFDFADNGLRNQVSIPSWGGTIGAVANHGLGIFTGPPDMANYYFSTAAATLISNINTLQSTIIFVAGNLLITDEDTQLIINTKQAQHGNLDKLSGVTLTPGSLFRMDGTAANVIQTSMSDFVAGIMSSVDAAALGGAMALPYSSITGKPTIPTLTSQLTNDSSFITSSAAASTYVAKTVMVNGHALSSNVTVTASDVGAPSGSGNSTGTNTGDQVIPSVTRTTSPLSLSLVGTGATGTQISSSKDSTVRLTVSTSTTSTIGGPSTSLVALKICSTNNATEGNWTTVTTLENDQTITLAIALNSIQVLKGQICADVPAGWYVKLVNSGTGTHSEAFLSGQQTIYG